MATYTSALNLKKPTGGENVLIGDINGNMDAIDVEAIRSRANFAGTYDASSSYSVGDYCIYGGNLFRCTTAIGSGGETWTAGHWTQVAVGEELSTLNGNMAINLLGNVSGATEINLPQNWSELFVRVRRNEYYIYTFNIIKSYLTDASSYIRCGFDASHNCTLLITNTKISLSSVIHDGNDEKTSSTLLVYYRK